MKKIVNKLGKILVMIALCLVGAAGGFFLSVTLFSGFFNPLEVAIGLLGIFLCFYVALIVHEGGHLVFGLLTGYRFSSFRIGSFMWIKQEGRIRLRRFSLAGTGGQCLMLPPEPKDGSIPVVIYNLGGVFANLILCVVFVLAYFFSLRFVLLALIFLFGAIVSFVIALTNGLPLDVGGIPNDGMNALHLSKDPVAAIAFRNQLLMNAAQTEGTRLSAMPDEWFTLPEGADKKNVHCASIAVFAVSRYLDRWDTLAAEQEITRLLHSGYNIIGLHRNLLTCDLICAKLINDPTADVSPLITPELSKIMQAMKTYPSVIRTEYIIALLHKKNKKAAEQILASYDKKTKKFPYRQEIDAERALMLKALEMSKNE